MMIAVCRVLDEFLKSLCRAVPPGHVSECPEFTGTFAKAQARGLSRCVRVSTNRQSGTQHSPLINSIQHFVSEAGSQVSLFTDEWPE